MKYQNLSAFEKHLEAASKLQLARVFLIVCPCPYERKKIASKIVSAIQAKEGQIETHIQEASHGAVEELNTLSLLGGQKVLLLDGIDKLKKNGLSSICAYVSKPSPFAYLVLNSSSNKGLTELYTMGKKELIACDLSDEKPWDRRDRLKRSLLADVGKAGKRISMQAFDYLLDTIGLNLPTLEQEIAKLITYAAEKNEITLQDVQNLCGNAFKEANLWQIAEALVWQDRFPKMQEGMDLGQLLLLIACVRSQLQNGYTLTTLLERGAVPTEMTHFVPGLKSGQIDKMLPLLKQRKSPFFKRALGLLFDTELMTKNAYLDPLLIWDLFVCKLKSAH